MDQNNWEKKYMNQIGTSPYIWDQFYFYFFARSLIAQLVDT